MSTKAIRELIEDAGKRDDTRRYELTQKALAEVEALEKAARFIVAVDTLHPDEAALRQAAATQELMERIAKETQG